MKYWIIIDDTRLGPMDIDQLSHTPGLTPDTPVWREGLPDWTTMSRLPETAWIVVRRDPIFAPGQPAPAAPSEPLPPNYLIWAILSTLCCCLPTGIVAIIYASKVNTLYIRGDIKGAKDASEKAAWWVIISFVAGLIWAPLSAIWSFFSAFAA